MSPLRALLYPLLLCVSLLAHGVPSSDQVQASLNGLAERKLAEAEEAAIKATLEQTLAFLRQRDNSDSQLKALRQQLEQAPRQVTQNQRELAQLKQQAPSNLASQSRNRSVEQLEQLLGELNKQLGEWQQALGESNSQLIAAQTRPERTQAQISNNQTRSQQISNQLKSNRDGNRPLSSERRDLLQAELAALDSDNLLLRESLAGNNQLLELASSRRDLLNLRIGRLESDILTLQELISDKRRAQSEQTVAELGGQAQNDGGNSLLQEESLLNQKYSEQLLKTTDRLNSLTSESLQVRQQLDNLSQAEQALEEQINVLRGSLLLSKILYQQKLALPRLNLKGNLTDEIADLRLRQFELGQQRALLSNVPQYIERRLGSHASDAELHSQMSSLAQARSELLERLDHELNALLNVSITLQLNQKQLQSTANALRQTLDEQMFWIPSNRPLDLAWLQSWPQLLQQQLLGIPWQSTLEELWRGLGSRPWLFIPVFLLALGLFWHRQRIKHRLQALDQDIGHYKRDSQLHTPQALLLNLLLALPVSLLLLLGGLALEFDARGQNVYLAPALLEIAQAWLVLYCSFRILRPHGIAERHFHWDQQLTRFLFVQIRRLGLVVIPLVAVVTIAENHPSAFDEDALGMAIVLIGYSLMTWLLARLLLSAEAREHASPLRLLLGLGITLLPLGLIIAVGFGYYYTALKLTDRLIDTLYLLLLWVVVEASFVRGLSVAARRLAYQRALSKRQSTAKDSESGEAIEEPSLDIEQVNQQSLRLIRLTLLGVFGVALYWVWADLLTVFTYLNQITLYQYTSGSGETATLVPLSLGDLIGAIVIVMLTVVLARNLPGLLEVLVLSRLRLAQGSAYATTALLSYLIVGLGSVVTLSTLGVSWDKLQWLVAALSVGIGFGMQEIFANFISGLIILFERPVRIGDVVTIGNLSGTVSRIRIRATTITDFDRKEIIVPNKTFITGQLVNWSLSDTVTRVTIRVGVGYGSDLELVRRLLLQIAQHNPRVLREPNPMVYFLNFGESTLDHELRIHVRELGDRNPAIDEINREIDRQFKEHGIEIAFRQLDVFIKNVSGQQLHISEGPGH